jgi:tetratricopeptide (TPR) repeat protein
LNNTYLNTVSLLIAVIFLTILYGCTPSYKSGDVLKPSSAAVVANIDALIKTAERIQGAKADSMLLVSQQLQKISSASGNRKAQLYAEIFGANYYWLKADHTPAMQKALKALAHAEQWQMTEAQPRIYSIISNLHKESHNYELAFKAIDRGIAAAKQSRDTADLIMTLGNKAMFTHGYYFFNDRPQDDTVSLGLQLTALKLAESDEQYESKRIQFYNNIAQTYKERNDYNKALYYGNKAVVLAKKYNRQRSLTYSYNWLGEAYFKMGDYQQGFAYLKEAVAIATKIKEPYRRMELNETIYQCYQSKGDYKEALSAYAQFEHLKDSLQILKNSKQLNELQLKYDAVKKDEQIAILNSQDKLNRRNVLFVTLSAIIFLVLFIMILIQYFIIRKNHALIADKNSGLNAALLNIAFIQSHEIRKPLATLLGIINLIKEDDYHTDQDMLRMIETSANNLDTKIREIIQEVEGKEAPKS